MTRLNIGITTDSVCDMPKSFAEANDIAILRFYVTAENGTFRDGDEISSQNVVEYYKNGGEMLITDHAPLREYTAFFRERLEYYKEIIHISISSGVNGSYARACEARKQLGLLAERIYIIDSRTISSGMAFLVMKAAQMRDEGASVPDIIKELEEMRGDICVSFLSKNPEQMFRNGRMSLSANQFCSTMHVHPIFTVKNGRIAIDGIAVGNMRNATKKYVRRKLRKPGNIDTSRLFITHVGFSYSEIAAVRSEVDKQITFSETIVNEASATVSGNSGSGTVGLLFMKKRPAS